MRYLLLFLFAFFANNAVAKEPIHLDKSLTIHDHIAVEGGFYFVGKKDQKAWLGFYNKNGQQEWEKVFEEFTYILDIDYNNGGDTASPVIALYFYKRSEDSREINKYVSVFTENLDLLWSQKLTCIHMQVAADGKVYCRFMQYTRDGFSGEEWPESRIYDKDGSKGFGVDPKKFRIKGDILYRFQKMYFSTGRHFGLGVTDQSKKDKWTRERVNVPDGFSLVDIISAHDGIYVLGRNRKSKISSSYVLYKFNHDLQFIWTKESEATFIVNDIVAVPDGILLAGSKTLNDGKPGNRAWVQKLNHQGIEQWAYSDAQFSNFKSLNVIDGDIVATGMKNNRYFILPLSSRLPEQR